MFRLRSRLACLSLSGVLVCLLAAEGRAADTLEDARELMRRGKYEEALEVAGTGIQSNAYVDGWHLLKAEVELTLGRWEAARQTLEEALQRHSWSIQLRWLARDAYRRTGDDEAAGRMLQEILRLAEASPWRFSDPRNLVVLGEVALELGADAKEVLSAFFERAAETKVPVREPALAIGRLALTKNDFQLAAATYRKALEQFPEDPALLLGLATAVRSSDPPQSQRLLAQALELNPRFAPALMLIADQQIDAEEYEAARETLAAVLKINPAHDEALASLAVLAHLDNDPAGEQAYREEALASWPKNPAVDHLIGRKLSQKYRFREGVDAQWRSLEFDPSYLPARRQAAQDLLRLGEEDEGWQLAAGVFRDDAYDVTAYNLVTLRDALEKFTTLESSAFTLRMESQEARIYGDRVLALLERARTTLCAKYGLTLEEPVLVEVFPNPADFEVRTFGMPGVPGFLGVCFGRVITANSPAAQAATPANWEAVLWHEFCHVVTLQLTRNRMPRWLSEGISVYEERLADPRWGQAMSPAYQRRILDGGLVPIAALSGAFLDPDSDIQYAYFQSALVVEFLVDHYGLESLKSVLSDLGDGLPINEALPRHTEELPALEAAFAAFAMERARSFAPQADWSEPDIAGLLAEDDSEPLLRQWISEHPENIRGLMIFAALLSENERWDEASETLQRVIRLYPGYVDDESPYLRLAAIHQQRGDHRAEAEVLEELAARDAAAGSVSLRLLELAIQREDWPAVDRNAARLMAVNPLTPHPHDGLARAAEARDNPGEAAAAYRSLLAMAPHDPSELHFRLARCLQRLNDVPTAKRHVLMALENAPRYREAQRLLLQLVDRPSSSPDEPLLPELAPSAADKPVASDAPADPQQTDTPAEPAAAERSAPPVEPNPASNQRQRSE